MVAEDEGEQGALARTCFGRRQLGSLRDERGKRQRRRTVVSREQPPLALPDRPVDVAQDPPLDLPLVRPAVAHVDRPQLDELPPRLTLLIFLHCALSCCAALLGAPCARSAQLLSRSEQRTGLVAGEDVVARPEGERAGPGRVGEGEVRDEGREDVLRAKDEEDSGRAGGVERGEEGREVRSRGDVETGCERS